MTLYGPILRFRLIEGYTSDEFNDIHKRGAWPL